MTVLRMVCDCILKSSISVAQKASELTNEEEFRQRPTGAIRCSQAAVYNILR